MEWENLERACQTVSQVVSTQKNSGDNAEEILPQKQNQAEESETRQVLATTYRD
jgi:hypothetical protein